MHDAPPGVCTTIGIRAPAGLTLYAMVGPCDQSTGMLLNFSTGGVDAAYTSGTRVQYTQPLVQGSSPLGGDQAWYTLVESQIPSCGCWSVFRRIGGSPAESDPLLGSGSIGQ